MLHHCISGDHHLRETDLLKDPGTSLRCPHLFRHKFLTHRLDIRPNCRLHIHAVSFFRRPDPAYHITAVSALTVFPCKHLLDLKITFPHKCRRKCRGSDINDHGIFCFFRLPVLIRHTFSFQVFSLDLHFWSCFIRQIHPGRQPHAEILCHLMAARQPLSGIKRRSSQPCVLRTRLRHRMLKIYGALFAGSVATTVSHHNAKRSHAGKNCFSCLHQNRLLFHPVL